ncbi:MAG: glutamine-hydrolyzing carbamoyl-phosphate synthase small subunit [Acidobacteriota bacterium]
MTTTARLVLEDGTVYDGQSFGSTEDSIGEVVFNTSLTGYQEIATDPSYRFQIVIMTYPHIGNYGINESFDQSTRPQVAGFVVRDASLHPSNASCTSTIDEYFQEHGVSAITGVDTRALTRRIRTEGAMRGLITTSSESVQAIVASLKDSPSMSGLDLVKRVSTDSVYKVGNEGTGPRKRIAVYDFGVKRDILRQIAARGCDVEVFPAATKPDEILAGQFDGLVLSNGPGDPEPVTYAQENIRELVGRIPMLGICLGHQLLGLALGGKTYKLKFGHRGGNHPVKDLQTGRVEITSQNHGFSVAADSLKDSDIEFTHINLNDDTLEGFRHRSEAIVAVQYHPEAAPGPHDSFHLFDDFLRMIDTWSGR